MVVLQTGATGSFLLFVVLPAVALGAAIALSVYEVYRIGERKLLIVIVILVLMLQHQLLEASAFVRTGAAVAEGFGEVFETGANLVASGSVYYVLRFARRERQLLEDLERSEREYEQIFDSVNDAIAVRDPETGLLVDVNESYADLLGYDPGEMVGMGIGDVGDTDRGSTDDRGTEIIDRVMAGEGPIEFEWWVETANGNQRLMDVTATAATIGDREQYLAIGRDVTKRHEVERRLRRERDRWSMLFENSPDPIIEVEFEDGRPTITAVNGAFETVFGFDAETIGGLRIADALVPDAERDQYEQLLDRTSDGEPVETEVRRETTDGVREFLLRVIPFDLGEDEQRAYVWYTDVTERNRRQRELEEERERYSTLVEQSTDGVVVVQDETYVFVNERFAEITGYDRDELLDTPFYRVFTPEYQEVVRERYERRVEGDSPPSRYDAEIETADGRRLTLELAVSSITHGGDPATLATLRDVTDQRRRERGIRALHDATEGMQDADTFDAVAETGVEATREALDFPVAVCWWHDDEAGQLRPAVATEPARDEELVTPLSPDQYEYEVFQDGTVTEYDPEVVGEGSSLGIGVLFPLGEHGLMAAGRPEQVAYSDVILDVARILAEHTTTALNRVERAQEVREREQRFRLIADRIDEVIFLATGDLSEVLYVNPAYEEVWGRSIEELYDDPRAFVDPIDNRDRPSFEQNLDTVLDDIERGEADDSYEFEYRIRRPDGETRWLSGTVYPVELDSGERRFIGVTEDVTGRKRREQRLEVFNRVLRHNLRNRVDVIRSHAEALATENDSDHAERIITSADALATMGNRARTIDQFLSRDPNEESLDLTQYVADSLDTVRRDGNGVEVRTDLLDSAPAVTDERALTAVLESAFENAVEYADSVVEVTLGERDGEYLLSIVDDGPGIPEGELASIRAGNETKLRHSRGLGLWQLKWGVEKLNGEISFETDEGTRIRIRLPDRA